MELRRSNVLRSAVAWCLAAASVVTVLGTMTAPAAALPPDFEDTLVTRVSGPTEVAFTPDGRMLITGKKGQLRVYENGQLLAQPALDLAPVLCHNGERGLVGLEVHPEFETNRYIYLFYIYNKFANSCPESKDDGPVGRLSRFVLSDSNVVNPSSEKVLFETPPMYRDHHTSGDVKFGKDGMIYVTVGDLGAQSLGWPQDLGKLAGKIVRVTDNGDIPADNPYTGSGTARCNVGGVPPAGSPPGTKCQEIHSYGFRNPFRFAHDPNASGVRFMVNDVGQHTWEEISEGPVAGGDYGWPAREGPCAKDTDTGCSAGGPGVVDPVHWYHHGPDGGAATAGAFVPAGLWPSEYDGAYLWADYVFGAIRRLEPGGTRCFTCEPPTSGQEPVLFGDVAQVVSMRFGPYQGTQALYYVSRDNSEVRRIVHTGSQNRSPVAAATAAPQAGPLPLQVTFDGSGSSDPDLDPITYHWDFQDDGAVDATGVSATHTYTTPGAKTARLTVRDDQGASGTTTIRIDPGNTPPEPVIDLPTGASQYAVGDPFTLQGHATDDEDGDLPDTALTWVIDRHHAAHTHPFLEPTVGNDLDFTYPEPEDLDAARTSFLRVYLTATDSTGLRKTVSRDLDPKMVDVTFDTVPSGLQVNVSGEQLTGPTTVRSWENYRLSAEAPSQTDAAGQTWDFESWSDGGAATHQIVTPASPATYTATFQEGQSSPPATFTFTPRADTYVSSAEPDRNFGTRSSIRVDGSPTIVSYLKFDPTGLGAVTDAKLRVHPLSNSSTGFTVHAVDDTSWGETSLTHQDAPPLGAALGDSGRLTSGTWVEVPVTPAVVGNGLMTLALKSDGRTAMSLASREAGADAPQLVVTTQAGPADTTPPSVPGNLMADAVSGSRVDLSWNESTDNVGVTAYQIRRDGVVVHTTGAQTGWSDTSVSPGTTYEYRVRALDARGNQSGLSAPVQVTTPTGGGPGGTVVLTPTDDAGIRGGSPGTNYGGMSSLEVDNSPVKHALLRFDLSAVGGGSSVSSAVLKMAVTDSSSYGGLVERGASSSWSEHTVTYSSAPDAATGSPSVEIGRVRSGTTAEVDVTSLIFGDVLTLRISSTSGNGADYSSKEGSTPPQLVVTGGGGGGGGGDTQPPTAPSALDAQAVSSTQVDLSWDASTDNVGVTDYAVYRDGTMLTTVGPVTRWTDATVDPDTEYRYRVRALDAEGNESGPSNQAVATTPTGGGGGPGPGGELVLTPTDDATVREARPNRNYGFRDVVEVDANPVKHTLLRFDLSAATGSTITGATLALAVTDSSSSGGIIERGASSNWGEADVTWESAPDVAAGSPSVEVGPVERGTTAEVDVTPLVTGNVLTLRIRSTSGTGADFSTKEGSQAPQLVLSLS